MQKFSERKLVELMNGISLRIELDEIRIDLTSTNRIDTFLYLHTKKRTRHFNPSRVRVWTGRKLDLFFLR